MGYITIKEQREAFENAPQREFPKVRIEDSPFGTIESDTEVAWINRLYKGGTLHAAGIFKYGPETKAKERYENEYIPAYEDLCSLEQYIAKEGGLGKFADNLPFILHRMGYFRGKGRDITLFKRDGSVMIAYNDTNNKIALYNGIYGKDLATSLRERFKEILKETPSAAFFLYKPGKAVDFGLTSILFEGLEYQSAEDQLRYMQFPPEQEGNVELLASLEALSNPDILGIFMGGRDISEFADRRKKENICRRRFSYIKEDDQAEYWVFADGNFIGFNNRRAMPGYLGLIDKHRPGATILVHRIGEPLNFNLKSELRAIDPMTGRIDRNRV